MSSYGMCVGPTLPCLDSSLATSTGVISGPPCLPACSETDLRKFVSSSRLHTGSDTSDNTAWALSGVTPRTTFMVPARCSTMTTKYSKPGGNPFGDTGVWSADACSVGRVVEAATSRGLSAGEKRHSTFVSSPEERRIVVESENMGASTRVPPVFGWLKNVGRAWQNELSFAASLCDVQRMWCHREMPGTAKLSDCKFMTSMGPGNFCGGFTIKPVAMVHAWLAYSIGQSFESGRAQTNNTISLRPSCMRSFRKAPAVKSGMPLLTS
mmetsp:Transcript_93935/g.287436  ORF Transcript_93935/g.287436 Transcript_93935/m.287436 type:complete len:267 (+) Transcript_93935:13-813(+)